MTKPTPLTPLLSGLTLEDLELARAYHAATPDTREFMRFLAMARALTPAQAELVTRYAALSPDRQALVDDLVRELAPAAPAARADDEREP
jgi:hypothetical protein